MNFFDAQDRAKRATRWLVIVYAISTLLIVAGVTILVGFALTVTSNNAYPPAPGGIVATQAPLLVLTAIATTVFILGATAYKMARLSVGGGRVATDLGGTLVPADVQDPLRRRLRNVVEEMAIASGVSVPEIYVLEEENGINAFAAGYTPGDAAISVTRGALELLDRDELQGVIAHEFSHILNGDMRLNIRMMGVLFGILVLGLIGRMIVRGGYFSGALSSRRNRGAPVVLIIGLGLTLLGSIGVIMSRIIKAAVSRQREMLADASAVQFTRQNLGLANALKKIGGYTDATYLRATDPEEVSHMLFGPGSRLIGLFATHPPLLERIRALDPTFRADQLRDQAISSRRPGIDAGVAEAAANEATMGFAATPGSAPVQQVSAAHISASVGRPGNAHIEYARGLRQTIPENLYSAAHSSELAFLLAVALVMDRDGQSLGRQIALIEDRLGSTQARVVAQYQQALSSIGDEYRLPLLEVAFPSLKQRPESQLAYLVDLAQRLIEIDGVINLYEYCYFRILKHSLGQASNPAEQPDSGNPSRDTLRNASLDLLQLLAGHSNDNEDERRGALQAGLAALGEWATSRQLDPKSRSDDIATLDRCLDTLHGLNSKGRHALLNALCAVAAHDGRINADESELIRVVCATLHYPLPPILGNL